MVIQIKKNESKEVVRSRLLKQKYKIRGEPNSVQEPGANIMKEDAYYC
jgi:hypothetical protein